MDRPRLRHDTTEPAYDMGHDTARKGHDPVGPHAGACRSKRLRATWLARELRYKKFYRGWGRILCRNMAVIQAAIRRQRPMTRRRGAVTRRRGVATLMTQRAVRARQGLSRDTKFVL